ncbi:MAG: hypothetical protein QOG21_1037 [Actinomycetota bacterium]|nr:hypothetical protein [Actinomycetota bacterium]
MAAPLRDTRAASDEHQRMKRILISGAVAVVVYLIGATLTAHLSPFGPRPLLDGLGPPQPYRWVSPPADLAASNEKPSSGTFSLKFTGGRSEAGAFTTRDSQLSMVLDPGALSANGSPSGARISITPLAPSSVSTPPGYTLDGNVYRITITEQPSGSKVSMFVHPQRVILVYPADKSFLKPQHLLAVSADGKTWTRLKTADSTVQQQSSGLIRSPGLVAVVTPLKTKPSGKSIIIFVAPAIGLLLVGGFIAWRAYQRAHRTRSPRR